MPSKEVVIFAPLYRKIPIDGWGGVERIVLERTKFLRRIGFRVQLVANTSEKEVADDIISIDELFSYPMGKIKLVESLIRGDWRRYMGIFADHKIDIWDAPIISDASSIDPFNNLFLTKQMGQDRTLFFLHGNYYMIYKNWNRLFSIPDRLTRTSWKLNLGALNRRINNYLAMRGIRSHYMPSGTEFPEEGEVMRTPEEYLIFIGTINSLKAPHLAIDIAKRLGIPLKIVGRITDIEYFRDMIKPYLSGGIEYLGEVNRKSLISMLRRSMALLFTSSWNEPQGIVVIEAQSYGIPVIALDTPFYSGIYEMIDDFRTGFIGGKNDVVRGAEKIFNLNRIDVYRWSKARWAWDVVLKKYHTDVIAEMAEKIT